MVRKVALLVSVCLLAACGSRGTYVSAKVERVERNCEYTETATSTNMDTGSTTKSQTARKLDCSDDPEFRKIKRGDSRRLLKGEATAIVRYTAPDQQSHQAWVKVSASNRDFYTLETGQEIKVRIDPDDASVGYL